VTTQSTKNRERIFVERTAQLLGKTWKIGPDRERPDFIVTEGPRQFGVEVSEIFTGYQTKSGSALKQRESVTQSTLNRLRREFEASSNIPLRAQFVGDLSADNLAAVIPRLVAEEFESKPIGHHAVIDTGNGLRIHVTRAYRPEWFSVNDRVGWVDRNPTQRILGAIELKSKNTREYRNVVSDVRLLLVADRYSNSGKLVLESKAQIDRRGFEVIYFLSHPESVTVFD
jgi:hypothetical protein